MVASADRVLGLAAQALASATPAVIAAVVDSVTDLALVATVAMADTVEVFPQTTIDDLFPFIATMASMAEAMAGLTAVADVAEATIATAVVVATRIPMTN